MKKSKVLSIILGLIYYICGIIGFFILFVLVGLFGIIELFSDTLFWICFFIVPIIILILPIILKITLKKEFYKSILYSLISVPIYFAIIIVINFAISKYMNVFTIDKWTNKQYSNLRYLMVNDLEKNTILLV